MSKLVISRRWACALHSVIGEGSVHLIEDFTFTNGWEESEIEKFNREVLLVLNAHLVRGESINLVIDGSDNRDSYGAPYEERH